MNIVKYVIGLLLVIIVMLLLNGVYISKEVEAQGVSSKVIAYIYDISGVAISSVNGLPTKLVTLLACEDITHQVCRIENQLEYEDVLASQTNQVLGGLGAVGDLISNVYCTTSGVSVGTVSVRDGAGSAFVLFQEQAGASQLHVEGLNWVSVLGAWQLTTGTNTVCRVGGRFN